VHAAVRRTHVMVPTGHLALTLRPASWRALFDLLFAGDGAADTRFMDVGCGVGHGLFIAKHAYGVHAVTGVDFVDEVGAAVLVRQRLEERDALPAANVHLKVNDLMCPRFSLDGFTHAICLIDAAHLMEEFIAKAQRARSVKKIAFMVTRTMMADVRDDYYGFQSWQNIRVTLEGGGTSRTVCIATIRN
jgi:SAM-dependent methyltransferase